MSRMLWVGVGAVGGIYVYRRGERAWDRAKDRGVAGNAAVFASAAGSAFSTLRTSLAEQQLQHDLDARDLRDDPYDTVIDLRDVGRGHRSGAVRMPADHRGDRIRRIS